MAIRLLLHIKILSLLTQYASAQESSVAKPECQEKCGNVTISYPFGIGTNCSADQRFDIDCHGNPPKPYLYHDVLEVLNISVTTGTLDVNYTVFEDCDTNGSRTERVTSIFRPFSFSATRNRFTAMGCGNLALMTTLGSNVHACHSAILVDQKTVVTA